MGVILCATRGGESSFRTQSAAIEIRTSLVVLGRPAGETSAFELSSLKIYAGEIELDTGAEVKIV